MGQGFQRKIDTIADSIVSLEKNKQIDVFDISESIKKSICNLNDDGKLLVLEDLAIEAKQTPSTLLTTEGKISMQKLNEVVKSKIKEAEREGIDLTINNKKSKNTTKMDEIKKVSEGILTVAIIDKMLNNYDELSNNEINNIIFNYEDLSDDERKIFNKNFFKSILENDNISSKNKENIKNIAKDVDNREIYIAALETMNKGDRASENDLVSTILELNPNIKEEEARRIVERYYGKSKKELLEENRMDVAFTKYYKELNDFENNRDIKKIPKEEIEQFLKEHKDQLKVLEELGVPEEEWLDTDKLLKRERK